ncbi:MAG: CbiX/SirB N-terminal domain-containing protein [Candidatus Eremiobacteraeota bacterium]|nr:CbiX/SirB N-terminal domain-containing protein [Candidatus Eremiobacteraeota bacterium]
MSDAIVLAGHGSRSARANAALVELARTLETELELPVSAAFLEMAEPAIPAALRSAHTAGATRIVLVPYFLSAGMHVERDLAAIVREARIALGIPVETATFLGAHPDVPRLLAELSRAALGAGAFESLGTHAP